MFETLAVTHESCTLLSVQSSADLKRFTFSFRTRCIVYMDQLYLSGLVYVSSSAIPCL